MKTIKAIIMAVGFFTGSAHAAGFAFEGEFTNDDQVQEFNFAVTEPTAEVELRTYFGGETGGFDTVLALFNASTGILIDQNDEGYSNPFDSFLMSNLTAGSYTATLTQSTSFANGPLLASGFTGSGQVNFAGSDPRWALLITGVESASVGASYISPIPEPETYAMFLAGLGLLGWRMRNSRSWSASRQEL